MSDLARLTELPTRPLTMVEAMMEFAFQDDQAIYVITYTKRAGAPNDPTKLEFDVTLDVLDLTGELISPVTRTSTQTILMDPTPNVAASNGLSPADHIMSYVMWMATNAQPWATQLLNPVPLYQQLMP